MLQQIQVIQPVHYSVILTIYSQNPDDLSMSSPDPEPKGAATDLHPCPLTSYMGPIWLLKAHLPQPFLEGYLAGPAETRPVEQQVWLGVWVYFLPSPKLWVSL